jgi:hypothetical protein
MASLAPRMVPPQCTTLITHRRPPNSFVHERAVHMGLTCALLILTIRKPVFGFQCFGRKVRHVRTLRTAYSLRALRNTNEIRPKKKRQGEEATSQERPAHVKEAARPRPGARALASRRAHHAASSTRSAPR